MARRGNGFIKAGVTLEPADNVDFSAIENALDDVLEKIAGEITSSARATTEFKDRRGKLRSKIKMVRDPSGYGWRVEVRWNTAHLVEFGHDLITSDGRNIGHVPARPFLRMAAEDVLKAYMGIAHMRVER